MARLLTAVLLVSQIVAVFGDDAAGKRKNILFLVSDDMRPELGAYLGPDFPSPVHPTKIHSPNLDRLAAKSALLKKAFVQQALCSPSRTSMLTSRRPDTTRIYDIGPYWREEGGNFTTIPQFFKENGYITQGLGKIFHPGKASGQDDPISWTQPYFHAPIFPVYDDNRSWKAVNKSTYEKYPLEDQTLAKAALTALKTLAQEAKKGNPFFLAVGFHKPHLPFQFPEEFLSLYPQDDIYVAPNQYLPKDLPPIAWNTCGGLKEYHDIKKLVDLDFNKTVPDWKAKQLRRAYYSALSYTDSLIGEVLSELEAQGLENDTIVTFWGDHGWQLGKNIKS